MSMLNQTCKTCGKKFHNCTSCDNFDSPWLEDGYCSEDCWENTSDHQDYLEAVEMWKDDDD